MRFLRRWLRSMLPIHTALLDERPWITFHAQRWLESNLDPCMSVFEYGCGGSTLFLFPRVRRLVSVEHDRDWHARVREELSARGWDSSACLLCEPEPDPGGTSAYRSEVPECAGLSFERYARAIEGYPDRSFDLVIVDGRARNSCASQALSKLKPGGWLMFDDAYRPKYRPTLERLSRYARRDFPGLTPYSLLDNPSSTSVWRIDE